MQVLLVTPALKLPGGVSEFNKMLLSFSRADIMPFILTGAGKQQNKLLKHIYLVFDIIRFLYCVSSKSIDIVHIGPSLAKNALKRDCIFCSLAKLFRKKVFVQWHGWNPDNEFLLAPPYLYFLEKTLFRADHIKFLSESFQKKIIERNYRNISSIGNTFIDDNLLKDYSYSRRVGTPINILFLSTISQNKGIYLALEVFEKIFKKHKVKLTIAGKGPELENVKRLVSATFQDSIVFTGHVTDSCKVRTFKEADIYLFPSYFEGMPTSVIEAMGLGLPVVCTRVGAIPDFFQNERMGFMTSDFESESLAKCTESLIIKPQLRFKIGEFNHRFVLNNFLASKTIAKIDEDYCNLLR